MTKRARVWLQDRLTDIRRKSRTYHTLNAITLSREHVLHNVSLIQRQHPRQAIIPVLKANAYGHGLKEIATILNSVECPFLAVDGYFEAGRIRFVTKHRLLVLGYVLPENVPLLDTKRCSFVVQDIATIKAFGILGRHVRIHLELNTGMNRLGIHGDEISLFLEAIQRYPSLELEGVMTHLADADDPTDEISVQEQVRIFDACIEQIHMAGFQPIYMHIVQTAGSVKVKSRYANALRLGIGLYGINPLFPDDPHYEVLQGLRPVLSLTSTIIKVIDLKKGDPVSYGGTFIAPQPMRIGVLPLGYYEGIPRRLSNKGVVTHSVVVLPIVGKVCMNHTMIDLRGTTLEAGDTITVFSDEPTMPNSFSRIGSEYGLFPYVLLVKLSSSIRRRTV